MGRKIVLLSRDNEMIRMVWSQKDVNEWETEMLQVWFPKIQGFSDADYEDLKKLQAKLAKSLKVLREIKY